MRLENEFTVPAAPEDVWKVLGDIPRVASCMPGASLNRSEGSRHEGTISVRLGPMKVSYEGVATMEEFDEEGRRARLHAEGRETRGQGRATADVAITAEGASEGTRLSVVTDLEVSGRVAQFGRGVLQDVSSNLLTDFADNLAGELSGREEPAPARADAPTTGAGSQIRKAVSGEGTGRPTDLDGLALVAGPLAKRLLPVVAAALAGALVVWWLRRR